MIYETLENLRRSRCWSPGGRCSRSVWPSPRTDRARNRLKPSPGQGRRARSSGRAGSAPITESTPAPESAPAAEPTRPPPAASDASDTDEPKIPSKFSRRRRDIPDNLPTFHSDVNTVQLDVAVLDNKGRFIPNIPRDKFRVLEDNVPQQIGSFSANADAPMTIAMVIEFSNLYQQYWSEGWYQTLVAAYGFVQTLKPEDYVAVIAYDMRSEILSDFTTDRQKTSEAMQRLRIAGFSEANLFDALVDTEQRMTNIEGRKAILLIASGRDTFSKLTFDKARKAIQEAAVPDLRHQPAASVAHYG